MYTYLIKTKIVLVAHQHLPSITPDKSLIGTISIFVFSKHATQALKITCMHILSYMKQLLVFFVSYSICSNAWEVSWLLIELHLKVVQFIPAQAEARGSIYQCSRLCESQLLFWLCEMPICSPSAFCIKNTNVRLEIGDEKIRNMRGRCTPYSLIDYKKLEPVPLEYT